MKKEDKIRSKKFKYTRKKWSEGQKRVFEVIMAEDFPGLKSQYSGWKSKNLKQEK